MSDKVSFCKICKTTLHSPLSLDRLSCPVLIKESFQYYLLEIILNNHCFNLSKKIIKHTDQYKKENSFISGEYYSPQKHDTSLRTAVNNAKINNLFLLIGSAIETCYFYITNNTYDGLKDYNDFSYNFEKDYKLSVLCGQGNLFERNKLQPPCHTRHINLAGLLCNIIKHDQGMIRNQKSGSILIKQFGYKEGQHFLEKNVIHLGQEEVDILNLDRWVAYLYIFYAEALHTLFGIPFEAQSTLEITDQLKRELGI